MVAALSPAQQESLIFQTMEFFRAAESTRTDIYIAEREREVLELQYQSVRDAFIARAKDFSLTRQGSETYLRAMQGLATRSMQQYVMNSRRIAMLAQMHESLRRSRERISELGKQNITKSVEADSVDILHIKLLPGAQEALLFVGQHLRTPYGEGVLRKISPKTGHLTVQLSFGTMFTTISTLLSDASCRRFALSDHLSSSVQLLEDWDAISTQRCLGLSNESQRIVNRLLSAPHSSGGQSAEAVVDADDEGDLSDVGTTSHGADMNESAGSVWNPEEFAALVLGPAPLLPLLATKHLRSRPHPLQRSIVSAPRKDDVEAAQR